jgi:hypothetical protein
MYAVYDAHTAEKIVDIFNGSPARQVSDLYKHVVFLCYYSFYTMKIEISTDILHKIDNTPVSSLSTIDVIEQKLDAGQE